MQVNYKIQFTIYPRFHSLILTEYNLELLDKLPKEIYINQANELPELPALLDEDNVNEFRRLYDDGYNRVIRSGSTGNKRIPPTKPFVEMLILLDLLKREAKQAMLNMYHVIK